MNPTIQEQFDARWKWGDDKRLAPLRESMLRALDLHETIRGRREALAKDRTLTTIGQQDRMREMLAKEFAPELARASRVVEHVRAKLDTWYERLQPPAPDKTDAAGAMLRLEMRMALRGMSNGARLGMILKDPDPLTVAAVLEAASLAGVDDETRDRVLSAAIERAHPKELAGISETEEALEFAEAAAKMASNAARDAAEFPNDTVLGTFIDSAVGDKRVGIDGELTRTFGKIDIDDA